MKRVTYIICSLALVLIAVGTISISRAGIVGTEHDFSSESWSDGRICLPCHVSHNARVDEENYTMALWNHDLTEQNFTMFADFSVERTDRDQDQQPGGPSKLCLSCHDGVTAVDAFGGGPESPSMFSEQNLGTDLRDDHPIGIQYPEDGFEGYNPRDTLAPVKLVAWGGKVDRVECTSCHEPHNDDFGMFLRMDNTGSALCLQCHDK